MGKHRVAGSAPAEEIIIAECADVDEQTVAYILATRKHFEDLRQVAAQLAGLLVLAAAGGKSATPDHPMLEAAEQLYRSAADGVRSARPTERAQPHHHHLLRAAETLGGAVSRARTEIQVDPILKPLQAAYAELQLASRELPGFEIISFEHGCCAGEHGRRAGIAP
ncbi:MAG TPA: hypothetical protein VN841_27015 [Bryobacteraceae bacterium]|nr:hypothetical protein [Bryobacteraceae bacterium]